MNDKQKSNLARTAIYLLEKVKPEKFDMMVYLYAESIGPDFPADVRAVYNECGSTCCFAGHGPIALPRTARKGEEWEDYVERTFGILHNSRTWDFLFASRWADNLHQAAARALVMLEKGIPEDYNKSASEYHLQLNKQKLIERLRKFVIATKPKAKTHGRTRSE